jgi:hypothetical protein
VTTVFPCYAQADGLFALETSNYIAEFTDVRVFFEEGVIGGGETLIGKTHEARMADVIVVILSPDSVPSQWIRKDWEEAFVTGPAREGVRIGFLLRSECAFPKVFRQDAFFTDRRALKRWIRTGKRSYATPGSLEALAVQVSDRPGSAETHLANEFVRECGADFDATFWLRCGDRTLAQLAGDLGSQMGLCLEGEPTENAFRIRNHCASHRWLLVLEDGRSKGAQELVGTGLTSTLITDSPVGDYQPTGLPALQQRLANCLMGDWAKSCSLARQIHTLAHGQRRFAEAFEAMLWLDTASHSRDDQQVRQEAIRKQIWILEHWDRLQDADRLRYELRQVGQRQTAFQFV